MEQALQGRTDLEFLKRVFGKLSANYGWWVNRKDRSGNNLYEGGFLGLDNIGVFDPSSPLPTGGYLEQANREKPADGSLWPISTTQRKTALRNMASTGSGC
jgi:hypothetical protein